jgi:hypothetical protein
LICFAPAAVRQDCLEDLCELGGVFTSVMRMLDTNET